MATAIYVSGYMIALALGLDISGWENDMVYFLCGFMVYDLLKMLAGK